TLFAGLALFGFARRLVPWLGEMLVPAAAPAPVRHSHTLSRLGQIGQPFAVVVVDNHGAGGNEQNHVRAGMSRAIRTFAMASTIGAEFAIKAIAQQRVVVLRRFQDHAAARAAVAARRPAARHEFLPAEGHAAVSAIASLD